MMSNTSPRRRRRRPVTTPPQQPEDRFARSSRRFLQIVAAGYGLWILLTLILLIWGQPIFSGGPGWWAVSLAIGLLYTAASIRALRPTEIGTKTFLGRRIQSVREGFTFVPLGLCGLSKEIATFIELEVGIPQDGDPTQEVAVGDRPQAGDVYKARVNNSSMRITSASRDIAQYRFAEGEEAFNRMFPANDELNHRLSFDPFALVFWRIQPGGHPDFLGNVGTLKNANTLIDQTVRAVLQEFVGTRVPGQIIADLEQVRERLKEGVEILVGDRSLAERKQRWLESPAGLQALESERDRAQEVIEKVMARPSWGIQIYSVRLTLVGLPHRVNKAIADARKAGFDKVATITKAEADREKLKLEGEGLGDKRRYELEGEAVGLEAIRLVTDQPGGRESLHANTVARTFNQNDKIVMVDSSNPMAGLLGALATSSRVLSGQQSEQPPAEELANGEPEPEESEDSDEEPENQS